jgi:GT2 family glycosyltransferase
MRLRAVTPLVGSQLGLKVLRGPPTRVKAVRRTGVVASVVVVVYNAPEETMQCLESLANVRVECSHEVVIVDNGSDRKLVERLRAFVERDDSVILNLQPKNVGFARGVNIGVAEASGDIVVLLNSDTVVTDGWLDGLVEALDDPRIGAVSPVTNSVGHGPQGDPDALDVRPESANAYALKIANRRELERVPLHLAFFCAATRRADFVLLNGLDESYGLGNFEDDDFCLRLILLGYELAIARHVFVYHRGSATFEGNRLDHGAWLGANADRFLDRSAELAVRRVANGSAADRRPRAPLLSIVVRTKDRPQELGLALRSLANQTDRRFEVVIVNDGGAEPGASLEAALEGIEHRVVHHAEPVGRSGALNAGVEAAKTDLIAYLDDDDIVLPFHVATLLDLWERNGRTGSVIAYSHYSLAFIRPTVNGRNYIAARKRLPFWPYSRDELLVANRPAIHTIIHGRALWETVNGFDPGLTILHDWDFLLRATSSSTMVGTLQETCEYRIYPGAANVTTNREVVLQEMREVYDRFPTQSRSVLRSRRWHLREWEDQIDRLHEIDDAVAQSDVSEEEGAISRLSVMFGVALLNDRQRV